MGGGTSGEEVEGGEGLRATLPGERGVKSGTSGVRPLVTCGAVLPGCVWVGGGTSGGGPHVTWGGEGGARYFRGVLGWGGGTSGGSPPRHVGGNRGTRSRSAPNPNSAAPTARTPNAPHGPNDSAWAAHLQRGRGLAGTRPPRKGRSLAGTRPRGAPPSQTPHSRHCRPHRDPQRRHRDP